MNMIVLTILFFHFALFVYGEPVTEDIIIKFVEPIDVATKLLYDLDQKIQLLIKDQELAQKDATLKTSTEPTTELFSLEETLGELMSKNAESVNEDNNIASLLNNLTELDKKLQSTFQDLQTRRRYVLGAMIRQMQSTIRRIRTNVSRMQIQLNTIETVATQVPLIRPSLQTSNTSAVQSSTTLITANKEIIEQLEERINTVSRKINEIVVRLHQSLNGTVSLTNKAPLNPIVTLNSIIQNSNKHKVVHHQKQTPQ